MASPFARKRYYKTYNTVELQNTFYDLPDREYALRLRQEAPKDFIYNMKAWQVITHPPTSPTWRRMKRKPSGNINNYGYLKPTPENLKAWSQVLDFAKALKALFIVIQTPPSFGYSDRNYQNALRFLKIIEKDNILIGWEPRGSWIRYPDKIRDIVCGTGVVHVTDPLRHEPVICERQAYMYFRLHGLGGREVNYRYRYKDSDLETLANKIVQYIDKHDIKEVYVMFNNIYMAEDSIRFRHIAKQYGLSVR